MSELSYDTVNYQQEQIKTLTARVAELEAVCAKVGELAERVRMYQWNADLPLGAAVSALLAAIPIAGESRQQATGAGDQREESKS